MKYFIYCRKSTDTEDKQVLSLDSQERELLEIAQKHGLNVVRTFRESMSAKAFGRPIFSEMMEAIEDGEADGILCWKLDRLARNFVDGGKIIDSLQRSVIKEIRTYEGVHLPSDNVLLIAVNFGMANQYVRDLSTNVKRGNREKIFRGEWPNKAPFGYLNDRANKTIIFDPDRAHYVPRTFELYLTGSHSFKDISDILYQEGLRTASGKRVLKSYIQRILTSIFYTGLMPHEGKIYPGKHPPLISKKTFDLAQDLMNGRTHPRTKTLFFPLRGFLTCENCGCALTSSLKKGHHYYYCTNGRRNCTEHKSYLRETYLYNLVSKIFDDLHFDEELIEIMYEAAKERTGAESDYFGKALENLESRLASLKTQESRLLDAFIGGNIDKPLYDQKSIESQNERVSLQQEINGLKAKNPLSTLEPTKEVFLRASRAKKEFLDADDYKKRKIIENLLWNLSIKERKVASQSLKSPYDVIAKAPKTGDISILLPD